MKKALIASMLCLSSSVFANTTPVSTTTTPNLLGNWLCEAVIYHGNTAIQTKNRVNYQANNQATENIQVHYYDKGELYATSNIRLGYRWELFGGRQKFENMMIDTYDLYNHLTKQSANFGEIALLKQSLLDQYQNDPWQTIVFIDKDTHQYIADDGSTGICLREVAK